MPRHMTEEHCGIAFTASPKAARALSRSATCALAPHHKHSGDADRPHCHRHEHSSLADTRLAPTHSLRPLSSSLWASRYVYPCKSWRRKPSPNLYPSQGAAATSTSAAQAHLLRSPPHAPSRGPPPKGTTLCAQLCPAALHRARCGSWHPPDPNALQIQDVSSS